MSNHTPAIESTQQKEIKSDKKYALAQRIAMGEAGQWYIYCLEDDRFYVYVDDYWKSIFDIEVLSQVSAKMPILTKLSMPERKQVLENLKQLSYKPLTIFNKEDLINFKEGLFSPKHEELIDHHPDYYSTLRMPYSYDWNAKCPLWEKTLMDIFEGDQSKCNILQDFCGYCLTRDTNREKALLLLGESRTGKSTILQTIRHLMGEKNCSSVPLKFISNPQYTPLLINKMVNIDSDVCSKAQEFEAEFKIITSGEPVSCNQKFVATFEFIPYCKLIMAANEFPRITDRSSAFYKRLILIPCNRVFEADEQDINLKKNLLKELPGIFNWAVDGLKRLNERGRFEYTDFMKQAIKELEDDNNPTNIFFDEHIVVEQGSYVEKGKLFERYLQWCKDTNAYDLSDVLFGKALFKKFIKDTAKGGRLPGNGPRIWRNLKYVESKDEEINKAEEIQWQER